MSKLLLRQSTKNLLLVRLDSTNGQDGKENYINDTIKHGLIHVGSLSNLLTELERTPCVYRVKCSCVYGYQHLIERQ